MIFIASIINIIALVHITAASLLFGNPLRYIQGTYKKKKIAKYLAKYDFEGKRLAKPTFCCLFSHFQRRAHFNICILTIS